MAPPSAAAEHTLTAGPVFETRPLRRPSLDAQLRLMLVSGGDERLYRDPQTGRNRYGVPSTPTDDEIWFSSSTASAITPRGDRAAGEALAGLFAAQRQGRMQVGDWFDQLRERLLALYGVPGAQVVLAASGTEAELVVLALGLAITGGPLTNIVTAPGETGSGVPQAAAGRHFLARASLRGAVEQGARLAGWETAGINVESIEIRDASGEARDPAAVDCEAEGRARRILAMGGSVLVHALDASKTGLGGVGRETARAIAQLDPQRALVVVDACQLRCSAAVIRADLASGLAVMITGSKFAGGPPFSGALLLPPAWVRRLGGEARIPAGLADYSARFDWPTDLRPSATAALDVPINLGLGLRWTAALAEIEAFETLPESLRQRIFAGFRSAVHARALASEGLQPLCEAGALGRPGYETIVPIIDTQARLTAKATHEALRAAADFEQPGMDVACHLGQPVNVGGAAALRVCASMPMASDVAARMARGQNFDAAFRPVERDLDTVFAKWAAIRQAG